MGPYAFTCLLWVVSAAVVVTEMVVGPILNDQD